MANNNFPHGLRPLGISASGESPKTRPFNKAVGYATAIFNQDAVNRVADNTIEASATPGTTAYTGVALNFGAASSLTSHVVMVSPDALYEAQGDGSGTLVEADLGLNANLVLTAGNASTKLSKHQIAESTKAATATLDVKLLEFFDVPDNEFGANARLVVMFNKHRLAPGVAGV